VKPALVSNAKAELALAEVEIPVVATPVNTEGIVISIDLTEAAPLPFPIFVTLIVNEPLAPELMEVGVITAVKLLASVNVVVAVNPELKPVAVKVKFSPK